MDIDPPEEAADGLSRAQLERLGLPYHHIHYRWPRQGVWIRSTSEMFTWELIIFSQMLNSLFKKGFK